MISKPEEFLDLKKPFTFQNTKTPVPADIRPMWRVSIIIIILKVSSKSNRASINKLHFLSSILRSREKMEIFLDVFNNNLHSSNLVVRFDPTLNRAVEIARAEGFVQIESGKTVSMTDKGQEFANKIINDTELFVVEKNYLNNFKPSQLTEKYIDSLIGMKNI